jgi:hypothetical protein
MQGIKIKENTLKSLKQKVMYFILNHICQSKIYDNVNCKM